MSLKAFGENFERDLFTIKLVSLYINLFNKNALNFIIL